MYKTIQSVDLRIYNFNKNSLIIIVHLKKYGAQADTYFSSTKLILNSFYNSFHISIKRVRNINNVRYFLIVMIEYNMQPLKILIRLKPCTETNIMDK